MTVNRMVRAHELEVRRTRSDTLLPGRTIEQLDQYYQGVRVWGGSVSRQLIGSQAGLGVRAALCGHCCRCRAEPDAGRGQGCVSSGLAARNWVRIDFPSS